MSRSSAEFRRWEAAAAAFYGQLILKQAHVKFGGLWAWGGAYNVVLNEDADACATDGRSIADWIEGNRPIFSPIRLVGEVPPGARRVECLVVEDHVTLKGSIRSRAQLDEDLAFLLPKDAPAFALVERKDAFGVTVLTERDLQVGEKASFEAAFEGLGLPIAFAFASETGLIADPGHRKLSRGRGTPNAAPKAVLDAVAADEAAWRDLGPSALVGDFTHVRDRRHPSTVVVDAEASDPPNLRNFLTMYRRVAMVLPTGGAFQAILTQWGVTPSELVELVHLGRVDILAALPIKSYDVRFLSSAIEARADGVILARGLMLDSMRGLNDAVPLIFGPWGIEERRSLLVALRTLAMTLQSDAKREVEAAGLNALVDHLSYVWADGHRMLHRQPSLGVAHLGVAGLLASHYERRTRRDVWLELCIGARIVEYAMGLSGAVVSVGDHARIVEVVSGAYAGLGPNNVHGLAPVAHGILAVNEDVPILEVATELRGSDIDRFRDVVGLES